MILFATNHMSETKMFNLNFQLQPPIWIHMPVPISWQLLHSCSNCLMMILHSHLSVTIRGICLQSSSSLNLAVLHFAMKLLFRLSFSLRFSQPTCSSNSQAWNYISVNLLWYSVKCSCWYNEVTTVNGKFSSFVYFTIIGHATKHMLSAVLCDSEIYMSFSRHWCR